MGSQNCNSNGKSNACEKFPYEIVDVDEETIKKIESEIHDILDKKSVMVGPKKYFLPEIYRKCYLDIYNFEARPDDLLLVGHPRSGTTVHSEMVWQIDKGLDFETSQKTILTHRFPILDLCLTMGDLHIMGMIADGIKATDDIKDIAKGYSTVTIDCISKIQEKRYIRTHLPISLMSPSFLKSGCKVIYVARNPKDMVVSYYHASQFFRPKESTIVSFKSFWKCFKNNWTLYSPYFEHVKEAWERRNDKNFLFLFYETTIKDMKQTITTVAKFLGKTLTDEQTEKLEDYLSIDKFKKNKSVNCEHLNKLGIASNEVQFIRSGKSGGWRKYFVGDLEKDADEWIREHLKDTDIVFPED